MGCTSSAPVVSEVQGNSTDDKNENKQNKDDEKKLNGNNDSSKIGNDLSRTNTGNNAHLNGNSSVVLSDFSPSESDLGGDNKENEVEVNQPNYDNLEPSEKISTLKEVIEHVMSNKTLQKQQSFGENSLKSHQSEEIGQETENHVEEIKENIETKHNIEELQVKEVLISVSPSQSECSRATRWEALTDMAAELPPSLTIDPITGHIYALNK